MCFTTQSRMAERMLFMERRRKKVKGEKQANMFRLFCLCFCTITIIFLKKVIYCGASMT